MIEQVTLQTLHEVLPLIAQYQTFYQVVDINYQRNEQFFGQFMDNSPLGALFVYRQDGKVLAFATVYFSFSSTITAKVGIMNDLFTLEDYRGQGIGKTLINHCLDYALNQGAARLQWVTALDNIQAQALYDSLKINKKLWFFYSYMPQTLNNLCQQ